MTLRRTAVAAALLSLAARAGGSSPEQPAGPPPTLEGKQPSGFVEMREVQVAYIGNAGGGHGTLKYQGRTYPFRIAGLGVGGIGVSEVDAEGEVYDLNGLADFPAPTPPASTVPSWARPASATSGSRTSTRSFCTSRPNARG